MATPISGRTYRFTNVGAPTRRLNLYSSGTASNGMNVVMYTKDETNEQKWLFDGTRLLIKTNTNFALDRYEVSGDPFNNNADIWTTNDLPNQQIAFTEVDPNDSSDKTVRIKLVQKNLYLTAQGNANGTATGKKPTDNGNVYWAALSSSSLQQWVFEDLTGGGSSNFSWPTESRNVVRYNAIGHDGADIAPKTARVPGDEVYAFMDGYVAMTGTAASTGNEGNTVRIHHTNPISNGYTNIRTQYMHLNAAPLVSPFQKVTAGQLIGYMGNTGNVDPLPTPTNPGAGTHLHFEVRGGTASQFPLGGPSSSGFSTGTVLSSKTYLDMA